MEWYVSMLRNGLQFGVSSECIEIDLVWASVDTCAELRPLSFSLYYCTFNNVSVSSSELPLPCHMNKNLWEQVLHTLTYHLCMCL